MSEDKMPYTSTPHVRHTTFGQLPIGAKFIFQHRDANSPNPWTKTGADTYDNPHQETIVRDYVPVTWLTDAEVEAERRARDMPSETARTPQWIVNDLGELGVMVDGRAYFLYKGDSLVYDSGLHDDGTPMLYRMVGKREFGEVCHPIDWDEKKFGMKDRYTRELVFTPGLSYGSPEDGEWKPLPSTPPVPAGEPSEIVTSLSADLQADATTPPTGASELARLVGLEGRVRGVVKTLRAEVDALLSTVEYVGYPQGCVHGRQRAVDLLTRALAGDGGGDGEEGEAG